MREKKRGIVRIVIVRAEAKAGRRKHDDTRRLRKQRFPGSSVLLFLRVAKGTDRGQGKKKNGWW